MQVAATNEWNDLSVIGNGVTPESKSVLRKRTRSVRHGASFEGLQARGYEEEEELGFEFGNGFRKGDGINVGCRLFEAPEDNKHKLLGFRLKPSSKRLRESRKRTRPTSSRCATV